MCDFALDQHLNKPPSKAMLFAVTTAFSTRAVSVALRHQRGKDGEDVSQTVTELITELEALRTATGDVLVYIKLCGHRRELDHSQPIFCDATRMVMC